ncbi:hypothetical protein PAMA_019612 [Pampus argenteus]
MESGTDGASSKGVFIPVSEGSDDFKSNILAPLQNAYLYEESTQSFRYTSAVLIKNSSLEKKYNDFQAKRREIGYSEEDLEETYGFLLFDDVNKANILGETGVPTGNNTCTTLGDPLKGVYISMYSDCLDQNRWYHGKSGYIAIIRLTKGRVKRVLENYTQNFTAPTVGFDCHVSEQLPSVSAKTSSFLAFERTQYYMYELLDDGTNETAQYPSLVCPFAIVSFSYTDTKAPVAHQEKSEEKKLVSHYVSWRGRLQIGTQFYDVGFKSTAKTMIPAKLPPVLTVGRAISMSDLRQLLPKPVFETCFSGEVFLDSLYCILCELVSSGAEETNSLSVLVQEIKEKDMALTIPLNDSGFLILLHSSHFLTYDDIGSSAAEVLQGMFVFPDSRVVQRDTKLGQKRPFMSSEILRVLPILSYAEGEVEKTPIDPSEDLCDVLMQHMQSYTALINPGLALSPSREASMFPDQYDVPDAHKHLYSSPEWNNRAWQSLRSYLNKPVSFQLSMSTASEILAAGQEERREDLDDDVYICLSSPEEVPDSPVSMGSEGQKSPANIETSEAQVNLTAATQNVVSNDLQAGDASKDTEKSDLSEMIKTEDMGPKAPLTPPKADDLPAELIVSITSAERTVTDESLTVISTMSVTKHNDYQLSAFSTAQLQTTGMNPQNGETVKTNGGLGGLPTKLQRRKRRRGHYKARKTIPKVPIETAAVQIPVEDKDLKRQKDDKATESSGQLQLNESLATDWRKLPRHKRKFRKLSSKTKTLRSATVGLTVAMEKKPDSGKQILENTIIMELDTFALRKKTERWDLKPVISECGRILVPHGSADFADQIKSLKDKLQSTKDEQIPEEMLVDVPSNAHDTVEVEQESSTAPGTAVDETEVTQSMDGGNHLQNVVSLVNPEQLEDGNGSLTSNLESSEHYSKKDNITTPVQTPPEAVQEKHTDIHPCNKLNPEKFAIKGEFLLSKLKSVLLRGKRKTDLPFSDETTANLNQKCEPCLKKSKSDSDTEMLKSTDAITGVKEDSDMVSVDPLFAYALGLTPKETPNKVQKTGCHDTQGRKDTSQTQEQTISDKQPQIIHRPPSIFPRRGRIKTLKKHQGIPTEYIKKKWWLHFQTPACYSSEKLKSKECTRDNSVRKTIQEKMHTADATDALNLLADLALGGSNDQVPPQPNPEPERKPESSLKKCGLTKDVTIAEQKSVLHALLRQSAARPIQLLQSPSPSHLVGGSELVSLISKEHDYSLPPSSSLLLGLPGTPFQVSPLGGSTRLLQRQQTMYGNGIQTLHPSVGWKNGGKHMIPESLKKHIQCRTKFRHPRTFVDKDGSLQVTRQWKENYDFSLDSKFSTDSKDRAIIRALHGPWDLSIQGITEEVRLIVHMWIGLFYSRSTARLFHNEMNFTSPCSKENSLKMSSETISVSAQSELNANSSAFAPLPSLIGTSDLSDANTLDLSKKDTSCLDNGSEILDLSLRNSSAKIVSSDPQVKRKETSVSRDQKEASETLNVLKSPVELHECHRKMVLCTEIFNVVNDVRSIYENKMTPLENIGCLEHTDIPSAKGDATVIPVRKEIESVSVQPEDHGNASGIGHVLHVSNNAKMEINDGIEKSEATERGLVQEHQMDSSKFMSDKQVDPTKEVGDVAHAVEHDKMKSKDGENWEGKEKPYQDGNIEPSLKVMHTVCYGNLCEDERQLAMGEAKVVSPGLAGNVNEDEDSCKRHEDENHLEKENGQNEKDNCIPAKEDGGDMSDQLLPMMCDSPDSLKEDCIAECNRQQPPDEQPPQAESTKDVCHDLELRKLCTLTDEHAISNKGPDTPTGMDPVHNEPAFKANSETNICLVEKVHFKAALPMAYENPCSLEGSQADGSVPQTKGHIETRSQNEVMTNFSSCSNNDREDQDTKSIEGEKKDDSTTQKEPFLSKIVQKWEAEVELTKETDWNKDRTNEGLEKIHSRVVIPFIGIDTSGEDIVQPYVSHSQGKVEEVVQGQKEIPFISETKLHKAILPIEVYGTEADLSAHKIPLLDVSETIEPLVLGSEFEDRCPTPTMDEKPYKYIPSSGTSTTSAFSGTKTCENISLKYISRSSTPVKDEMPLEQKCFLSSTVNSDHNQPHGLHPDLKLRTLRVLQSIDKILCKTRYTDKSSQNKTADTKHFLDQPPNGPGHIAADVTDKKINNTKPAVVAASTSKEPSAESSDHSLISPFKSKLEKVLGVRLQLKNTDSTVHQQYLTVTEKTSKLQDTSVGQDYCHPYRSLFSTESLQGIKPNIDEDRHKTTSHTQLIHEPRSYSQRPVMAVKPSKSDESQAEFTCIENSSKDKLTQYPVVTHTTPTSMLLERKIERYKEYPERLNDDKQEASDYFCKNSCLSNVNDSKLNSESAKASSKLVDGNQHLPTYSSVKKFGQTAKENTEMDKRGCSEALASLVDYKDDCITDNVTDSPVLVRQGSLVIKVYNTSQKRSFSFLEQVSQRCVQDNLTQASMEQECLIFSEQMKQLLKRTKRGSICQQDSSDKLKFPCVTPVTVHFSSLEEQEDSLDHLDIPSLVGQKIKVDMSDRKVVADTTEEETTIVHPERISQATGNPPEHAGVSGVTAECTTLYEAMMNNVCAGTKVLSRSKSFRMDRVYPKTEPGSPFDFCGQMKRKMDESFRSNLNSVVKKSCRTKYRFYVLVTSDDTFFEETKAQLEAEGHTAVQPSQFFLGEGSSSSLLIILRNEDIAEHICEVPHLLDLKKSPGVQFVGIDEPDDVVNLTYQELFTRGGFVMLDKAALELLSLCMCIY